MIKIKFISFSFIIGGAGMAASKFGKLLEDSHIKVEFISQYNAGFFQFFKRCFSYFLTFFQFNSNLSKHSLNIFSFKPVVKSLRFDNSYIHHLHWINNDTLSIFDFKYIPKGSIFTLHDEWLYCGAEHYYDVYNPRLDFILDYKLFTKNFLASYINYFVWKIKRDNLLSRNDIIYTVPSYWMLNRICNSVIFKNKDVRYLPNPIDHITFSPKISIETLRLRRYYSLNEEDIIICFGAVSGRSNHLKGGGVFLQALALVSKILTPYQLSKIILFEFGGKKSEDYIYGFRRISFGKISDNDFLSLIYSTSDFTVVPSYVESFGQVAAESLSCATPVVCFETSGLLDIVSDDLSGYFCKPFQVDSLAEKLYDMINLSKERRLILGEFGRNHVINNFSFDKVRENYVAIINDAICIKENSK